MAAAGGAPKPLPAAAAAAHAACRLAPWLPAAASRNMLPLFLLANVATGCVNLGSDTLGAPPWHARGIVVAYIAAVAAAAAGLDVAGVTLRL